MYVTKRNGQQETVSFDKILTRIKKLGQEADIKLNYTTLVMKVIDQLYPGISTTKIDELSAEQCASMASIHPDYSALAGRIVVSNHHKNSSSSFSEVMTQLYNYKDKHGQQSPLVSNELMMSVIENIDVFDSLCDYNRDYLIDYFGFKTLERAYLMKIDGKIVERPQHMWLRVAIGIHGSNMERIKETYELMSAKYFTHATPTLFNAGTPRPQLSSCFLLSMESDSIEGIYNTLKDCAMISKWAGGIGLHVHNIRASGSHIRGTNGSSNGLVPMLRVFNNTAKYVDQCVDPETIIYTTDGPKQIQHCIAGETQIYNSTGDVEVIQKVLEHEYEGEFLDIETVHSSKPLRITPEHPIYVLRGQDIKTHQRLIEDRLNKQKNSFEWIEAKDLNKKDMLVFPIPTYYKDIETITADDCYVYGIILGKCSNKSISELMLTNLEEVKIVEEYFKTHLVEFTKTDVANGFSLIKWGRPIHLPFRHADFFNEANERRIHPQWLNLPIHKSKYIFKGLVDTSNYAYGEIVFETPSALLVDSIRFLCMRMSILTRVNTKKQLLIPRTLELCDLLEIQYVADPMMRKFLKYDNFLLSHIKTIDTCFYRGVLYDLQMEKVHDYMLESGLVHNGGGKRNGSFAIYLEPWHADVEIFLQMRKNHGDEELKARDLFYALWISDLFMERVKANGDWTLMCPDECPGLADVYGEAFTDLYTRYETEGKGRKTMKARDLWFQILDAQMETGTPYLLYKDACNIKSNQKNVGTIKSSNLCTEIIEYSSPDETAVCNLASIALPAFVTSAGQFDFDKLHEISKVVTYNLNKIIDVNYYPTEKTERSNRRHRPIGIGVQGLADVFMLMDMAFTSEEAKQLNKDIFETIYHGALEQSCELAKIEGSYETFAGSPASQGILQFDLWKEFEVSETPRYPWSELKAQIMRDGLRNSLLLAPMPTASTSQILGYNECIEPITSNIYNRRTIAGEFILANKYLMNDLIKLDMWNEKIKNSVIANHGSIQHLDVIPPKIREKYRTVWEIPMRTLIDMAADRGVYICQSQSLNLWLEDPNYSTLTSMHFYSWSKGLKTGIYYLRRRGRHQAQQFTIEPEKQENKTEFLEEEEEGCEMCSA